ncbi:SIR2 family protein [Xanthobacter sp. DSM 14520]|uniref:SIR2 family protein n=1 Tax=Xanthobacter autotrophicus (strain ATCC BAA-1158 / Py2) TaxID=78245 RepID=UPI00372988B8
MSVREATQAILARNAGGPFLFVGSGFSRRYIGLDDWTGLLRRFCVGLRDFEYYLSSANGDMPKATSLISRDFHDYWWDSDVYEQSRKEFGKDIVSINSALKKEVAKYFLSKEIENTISADMMGEIEFLKGLNVDGIITTNWDLLIEYLFPEYKVFIGQEELLFSNPQAIAEIYKIHGCVTRPESMVMNDDDYRNFREKNPYLAAKLITLFIEHPIFFIGYSVTDPHIQSIIFSIASCLGPENVEKFGENLVFLKRSNGRAPSVENSVFSSGGKNVAVKILSTDDYTDVYSAIDECKRKIPARILRYCKEQMYELVNTSEPNKKMSVIDIDKIEKSSDIEFVVGVGAIAAVMSDHGYGGVTVSDLMADVLKDNSEFDAKLLLSISFPAFRRTSAVYIPIFRYLRMAGINSRAELMASPYLAAREVLAKMEASGYSHASYKKKFEKNWKNSTTEEIISGNTAENALILIAFQKEENVDIGILKGFIDSKIDVTFGDPYRSCFKKLICLYDRLAYGFS